MQIPISFELVTAVGRDHLAEACMAALQHDRIRLVVCRDHGMRTASCIVLSHQQERSFVSDRGCIGKLSLDWFGDLVRSFDGISHVHAAGYFNCTQLMVDMPDYFVKVTSSISKCRVDMTLVPLLVQAKALGITTSLNPQYDAMECWSGILNIAPFLTLFICNEVHSIIILYFNAAAYHCMLPSWS